MFSYCAWKDKTVVFFSINNQNSTCFHIVFLKCIPRIAISSSFRTIFMVIWKQILNIVSKTQFKKSHWLQTVVSLTVIDTVGNDLLDCKFVSKASQKCINHYSCNLPYYIKQNNFVLGHSIPCCIFQIIMRIWFVFL